MPHVLLSRTQDSLRSASFLQMSARNASASAPGFSYSWSYGERYLNTDSLTHLMLTVLPKVMQEITWLILLTPAPRSSYSVLQWTLTSFHIIVWTLSGFQVLNLSISIFSIFNKSRKNSTKKQQCEPCFYYEQLWRWYLAHISITHVIQDYFSVLEGLDLKLSWLHLQPPPLCIQI